MRKARDFRGLAGQSTARRKLAAILYADAVGFSRLMEADEAATMQALRDSQQVFRSAIARHGGRMVDAPGDALLADFASPVDAVQCAVEVQGALAERTSPVAEDRRMLFRIGINSGDVLEEDGALFGDGVNIAARVQALADPGGLCVSGKVFDEIEGRVRATFAYAGEQKVKNIAKPLRVYKWLRHEPLTLRFLGEMLALRGREAIPLPQSKKTRALLAYLAVTGRPHRRERLCSLLWDVPDDPRAALRWSLSKLRSIVDEPHLQRIVADRDAVAFEAHGAHIDVLALRARLAAGVEALGTEELEAAAGELSNTFLADAALADFFALSAWCTAEREALRTAQVQVLRALIARLAADPARALPYARTLVELDPADASAQDGLRQLQQTARSAAPTAGPTPPPAPAPLPSAAVAADAGAVANERSIAVLPFDNLTADPEQAYFVDGITDDLITALSKVSELFVIARGSTAVYRGRGVDPVRAAAELGVRYVLHGSCRRAGQRIRLTVQLIDARGGRTLWAERYDRDIEDVFAVQDDITKEIVTALAVKLTLGEQARLWRRHVHSLEAYEDYLRGLECYNQFTRAANRQARRYFESAVARSPDFAAAYDYLGWVHMTDAWFGWSADREASLALALGYAEQGTALDDTHADGYAVRAFVHTLRGDHDAAAVEAERAIALNPNGATVCHMLALVRLFGGDPEEAIAFERQALRLSPLAQDHHLVVLGQAYCLTDRYAEALEALEPLRQAKPHWLTVRTVLAQAYHGLGRPAETREQVAAVVRIQPRFSVREWARLYPFRRAIDRQRLIDTLRRAGLPDTDPAAPRPATQGPETKYARSGEVNIAFQVVGRGPSDLVFVPGWVSHIEYAWEEPSLRPFLERLARCARLILMDRRGTGLSDPVIELPTLEQRMDDLRAVMDAAGSARAFLFGISESGPMCTLFAATYPQRTAGLILCNTFANNVADDDHPWAPTPDQWDLLQRMVDAEWGTGLSARLFAPSRTADEAFVQSWGRFERRAVSKGAMRKILDMAKNTDVRHVLPSIAVPTLIVHRRDDAMLRVEGARYMADRIPGARRVEVAGQDHFPWVGDTAAILDEVECFVAGAPSAEVDRVLATVVHTDVAGAVHSGTAANGEAPADALARVYDGVRAELARFRGREIPSHEGGICAAFDGPARAIRCAAAALEAARGRGIVLRAGIHTGECAVLGDQLSGLAMRVAAAVCRVAEPGEVLASGTVIDLVAGAGLQFADRGTRPVKGIPGAWHLYAARA